MDENFNNQYNNNENNYSQQGQFSNVNNNQGYDANNSQGYDANNNQSFGVYNSQSYDSTAYANPNAELNDMYNQPVNEKKGLSIASLVLGIVSVCTFCCCFTNVPCSIIGIILGIVSLVNKKPGKGMAIAGIILCSVALLTYIIYIIYSVASGTYQEIYNTFYDSFMEGFRNGYNS